MRITWENIVHHVGTIYRYGISSELQNKTRVSIPKHEYNAYAQSKQKQHVGIPNLQIARLSEAREANIVMLNQAVEDGNDP